jgi:hypothetical protein
MTAYIGLQSNDAMRYLEQRESEDPIPLDDLTFHIGDGDLISMQPLESLRTELLALKDEFPSEIRRGQRLGGQFERRACELVHRELSVYPIEVLADTAFWVWIAVGHFADIIEWRYGSAPNPASFPNYGIVQGSENFLFRLWLRGDIGFEPARSDPYELSKLGDIDIWRSHIVRQSYANAREIARALLLLQSGMLGRDPLTQEGVRELAKQLKRVRANVVLEVLPRQSAIDLVLDLGKGL